VPPDPAWLPPDGLSDWINPNGADIAEAGDNYYTYQTIFTGSAAIAGEYSSDNQLLAVYLNGNLLPSFPLNSANNIAPNCGFDCWTAFDITTGLNLNPGLNYLDFEVYNLPASSSPNTVTGFRFETTPEPSSLGLFVGGCLLFVLLMIRPHKTA
jgi:hypothetical protein